MNPGFSSPFLFDGAESIEGSTFLIRSQKVILDLSVARLYGVSTRVLNQAVRRNAKRFPPDFMFQLTMEEAKSQGKNMKYRPYVFTEQGIWMLSTVLKSERAVQVNIEIMRGCVRFREMAASNADLTRQLNALERKYDGQFTVVFDAIRRLMRPPIRRRKPIGFRASTGRK